MVETWWLVRGNFPYFSIKTFVVCTLSNHLTEVILMSTHYMVNTHNIWFFLWRTHQIPILSLSLTVPIWPFSWTSWSRKQNKNTWFLNYRQIWVEPKECLRNTSGKNKKSHISSTTRQKRGTKLWSELGKLWVTIVREKIRVTFRQRLNSRSYRPNLMAAIFQKDQQP